MSDRREPREDAKGPSPALDATSPEATSPEAVTEDGLSPGLWVTGLIAVVLLLLAFFALV